MRCEGFIFFEVFMKKLINSFTLFEKLLWLISVAVIVTTYFIFGHQGILSLVASLIGVTSLIFAAKANPIGPTLMIVFSILYAIISFSFSYYGEMITYLGMTLPMSVFALVAWLNNPFKDDKSEVEVNTVSKREATFMLLLTTAVTIAFYYILRYFDTANLLFSTASVTTSLAAAYLTFRRSAYFALAYAMNDVILIILWVLASLEQASYISVVICFVIFLVNDLYGFYNWHKIKHRQKNTDYSQKSA